jgi:preprotein translocase subunit SecA
MTMVAFHTLFPDVAETEGRAVTPFEDKDLPSQTFLFLEAFCAVPNCDCRRVILNVIDAGSSEHVTTINYAFEPPESPDDDLGQMFLDLLNPQSQFSGAFLDLFKGMIASDRDYHRRLVRHYTMWKTVIDDPTHPDHEKIPQAVTDDGVLAKQEPIRRSGPKIGANDPCPCGSGRKYKKCCRT